MSLPVAILAGGLATRLRPITETIPKSLVDVGGEPFVVRQLALLRRHGITRVVLCVGHLAEQIEAVLRDGRSLGLDIAYSHDGPRLVGTGGALRQALPLLGDRFFVLYGDSYLPCDYQAVARAFMTSDAHGLMTIFRNDGRFDASNIRYERGRILDYDKTPGLRGMTHIDYGLSALHAAALDGYAQGDPLDLSRVYQDLLEREQLLGYEVHDRFYEIGSASGLEDTRRFIASQEES